MRRKRFLSLFLMAALVMSLLPAAPAQAAGGIWSGKAEKPPGWGTLQSPYLISTGEHLKWYADHVNSGGVGDPLPGNYYAVLMDDIVLNDTSNWQNWENSPPPNVWTPIGNAKNNFKATFDGMGHTISGIYINSTDSYQGLFGYLSPDDKVVIKNVKVARSYIRGDSYVGGICGYMNFFNKIIGCESGATVVGTQYTGGITGCVFNNSELTDCRNTGRVTGGISTGGIAGHNSINGTITRCVNQGTVSGAPYTGGLVGANDSVVSQSYNNGNVSGSGSFTGGICAANRGKIEHVYNSGSVSNGWPVCDQTFPGSSLTNVYYSGPPLNNGIHNHNGTGKPVNKSAEQFASGEVAYLMGDLYGQTLSPGGDPLPVFRNADNSNQVFRLTYMNGTVVHKYQYYNAGAAVSSDDVEPPTRDDEAFSHWDGLPEIMPARDVTVTANFTPSPPQIRTASPLPSGIVHKAYSAKIEATGTKPITFTLLSGALPTGLMLDGNTGAITGTPAEAGSSTVTIRAQNQYGHNDKEFSITISDQMPGTGQSNDPYQIWTANHLIEFANKVNSSTNTRYYAVLMADIELNDTSNWENWETNAPACTWTPIGIDSTYKFIGGFDGNNHTISGVYINGSGDYQGLFGYVDAVTTIKNLNLAKSYIKGKENVGGICGMLMNLCKIENCRSAATVHGEYSVGGLCGRASSDNASILNCQNEGTVTGSERAGGIVGNTSGTVSGCRNSGTVQGSVGSRIIGGICGNSSGAVTNVYNTGNVYGDTNIGGICGVLNGLATKTATLAGAYNSGNVTGLSNNAAICGVTNEYCQLSNCYYLDSSSASGIGYNPGNLTTASKSAAQFASGEVAYLLGTAFGQTLNTDAYPVFRSSDGSNAVYRLLYMDETQQHAAQYYNVGTTISAAGISTPSKSGHYFSHWDGLPSSMPAEDVTVSAVFLPITAPSEPQYLTAIPGDGQVILNWTAPADNGGSANIKYEVSRDNGANWTDVGSATGYTFTGLTNGQSYIFGVRAVNEAGAGLAATTSATPQATPPTISPTLHNFDLNDPADLTTVITWNSATSVISVVYGAYPLVQDTDFTIIVNDLTIKHSYLSSLSPTTGAILDIVITFNTGDTATLTVNVVDSYVKSSNANLGSLSVNGTPVNGFNPNDTEYDVELPYGSTSATVTATVEDPLASCVINNASVLPGSATVTVTAEDGTTKTYTINFTIGAAPFIAVTNITNVPAEATAGTTLTLTGTVLPANATNQTIIWSIQNPGTTGAMISGNMLSIAAEGTVIIRATIINGASESMDYIQDFSITVTTAPVTRYTITASAGIGGSISPSGAVSVVSGGSQTFTIIPDSGYRIDAVTVDGVNQGDITTYTFTNVIADHTINATFTRTSSGGGGGSGGSGGDRSSTQPDYQADVSGGQKFPITINSSARNASVNINEQLGNSIMNGGHEIITMPPIAGVSSYTLGIPVAYLTTSGGGTLTFRTGAGSITLPADMMAGIPGAEGKQAAITIGVGDKSSLPGEIRDAIGDRPLIELSLTLDGEPASWNNPNAPVTISIPYEPTPEELANPESIVIWYIDGNGNAVCIPNGHYDPDTGTVTFTTTHFSLYAVAYNPVSFSDVPAGAWYAGAVSFIAARDITRGTGDRRFSPAAKLTRAEFIVLLMKAYGIAPDTNLDDNFSDAGNTWYTNYLAAAKRLGITSGVGNNQYAPDKEITRQEMFTMLCNTLKVIGQLPAGNSGRTLTDFSDAGEIAPWAKDSLALLVETGIAIGSDGRLNPAGLTTRAEMAQVLYNLLGK